MLVPLDELWVVSLHLVQSVTGVDGGIGAIRLKYDSNLLVFLFGGLLKFSSVLEDLIYVLDILL